MSKVKMMRARDKKKGALVPRLRFPEFHDAGEWEQKKLGDICTRIFQKVTDDSLVPVSISAGQGFVSQESKFGRNISGAQYKNYIFLKYGDFAYNRGNSKKFPQGYVCQLKEFEQAAASSAFICFRFTGKYQATFFQSLFDNNIHGKQLVKHITSSARSDGLLNIKPDVFFSILLPVPHLYSEQQRIADCLSSLDERIAAETSKLERLKEHKKGLLGQLFPAESETLPRLRFPEFRNEGEWEERTLGEISTITSGGTPSRSETCFWNGNIPWVTTSLIDLCVIYHADEYITNEGIKSSSTKLFPKGTVLMAMYGQGKTRGKVALLGIEAATNQACAAIILGKNLNEMFIFQNLSSRYEGIRDLSNRGGQDNLSIGLISKILVAYPKSVEQQKIADCLSSLDELITAQTQKIDLFKDHKKGLMQQLFPRMDEVLA